MFISISKVRKELENDTVKKLLNDIDNEIIKNNPEYSGYSLEEILKLIYSNNDQKCVKIFQIIIDHFYKLLEGQAIDTILKNKQLVVTSLFKLPSFYINNTSQKIENDFNRSKIIEKLKTEIQEDFESFQKLKQFDGFKDNISFENKCKFILTSLKSVDYENINFDLMKCNSKENVSKEQNQYLTNKKKFKQIKGYSLSLEDFIKYRNSANKIKILQKYNDFKPFQDQQSKESKLKARWSVKNAFYKSNRNFISKFVHKL